MAALDTPQQPATDGTNNRETNMKQTAIDVLEDQRASDEKTYRTRILKAIHTGSQKNHGVLIHWIEVEGVIYGINYRRGITDRDGNVIDQISANIAVAIMLKAQEIDRRGPYQPHRTAS